MQLNSLVLSARGNLDIGMLADLWVTSWQEAMPAIDFAARRQWFCDHVPALEAKGALTICALDARGPLTGFMLLDPATGFLDQLVVAPAAKGNGVARLLLNKARLLSPKGLCLDVNIDNPRAMRFYEREGFERTGEGLNPRSGLKTWRLAWTKREG